MSKFYETAGQSFQMAANHAKRDLKEPYRIGLPSILAGLFIGLGMLTVLVINEGKLVSGLLFPFALSLVVFTDSYLFTGSNTTLQVGHKLDKVNLKQKWILWALIFLGNLAGAGILVLTYMGGGYTAPAGLQAAVSVRTHLTPLMLILRGVMCNFLVCLAIALCGTAESKWMKTVFCWLCIAPFVFLGFEHCVADMTLMLLGMAYDCCSWTQALTVIGFATLGNMIGGAIIFSHIVYRLM